MRIVGLDPGGTTGVAVFDLNEDSWSQNRMQLGPEEHHEELYEWLKELRPDLIIYESFEYRTRQRDNLVLVSVEYIGVIKLFCSVTKTKSKPQTAAYGKAFWSNDKIAQLALWTANMPHAMDATRHVLQYISFTQKDQRFLRALKPGS